MELTNHVHPANRYTVECRAADGKLRWSEDIGNLVTTAGFNILLDSTLKTGVSSPAWYVGLKGTGTAAAADTMASHAGWAEVTAYSESVRQAFTPGAIAGGSVDNSASKAVFSINGTATVAGAFLANNSTKGGSTGTLYSVGNFAASRDVLSGDTLTITVTATIS